MKYNGVINTFMPLTKERCLEILQSLSEDEMTADALCGRLCAERQDVEQSLGDLTKAGLVGSTEKDGQKVYFLSPFGCFGAVNMLKEILCVEQGCKGCSK